VTEVGQVLSVGDGIAASTASTTSKPAKWWSSRTACGAYAGVNRKSVTLAAQALQREGLIDYRRGRMQILNRRGLEEASCECYAAIKESFSLIPFPHAVLRLHTDGNSRDPSGFITSMVHSGSLLKSRLSNLI
jgi:hypothetical protein